MSNVLGELLLERGLITKEKLQASMLEQTVTKERLSKILVRNGFVRQDTMLHIIRELNPNSLHDESVYQNIIPPEILIETQSMIVALVEGTLYISTLSSPQRVRRMIHPYIKGYRVAFTATNPVRLKEYMGQLQYGNQEQNMLTWEKIFYDAMRLRASDIHIIPRHASYTVMTRRDGILHLAHEGPRDEYIGLVSRVKDLALMDMAERRRPQDGGFAMEYSGRVVNFRVVTVPTVDGERMVVRILDPDAVNLSLGQLGITQVDVWRKAVAKADGLCLICGPTGSGKTTTLSSTIREMNFLERAIYTVEDPVEYRIPYAGQVNVNSTVDLDFSAAVRNFMRADPDVIIVGEIRDIDTARNALKAGETGHLAIGTLHTGSILSAIGRLRDIGIEPFELRHLLRGIMVQRLMRIYCTRCMGKGCDFCGGSGYRGREVVSEVASFETEADVQAVINGHVSWPSILHDAKQKVLSGRTSAAELERVFGVQMSDIKD